jgi:hypothetical protein
MILITIAKGRIYLPSFITKQYPSATKFTIADGYILFGIGNRYFNANGKSISIKSNYPDGKYHALLKNNILMFLNTNRIGKSIMNVSSKITEYVTQYDNLKCMINYQNNC